MNKSKNNWENKRFEYSDKKLKELLKEENLVFEKSKFKFKKIANKELSSMKKGKNDKKINYKNIKFEQSQFENDSKTVYIDELNNLTTKVLVDVANNSYKYALDELRKNYPDNKKIKNHKPKEIDEEKILLWNSMYILGLRTAYNNELEIQSQYLAYRVSNAFNENIQKEKTKNKILNMNTIPMLLAYKIQKKKFSNLMENTFVNIVNQSQMELYKEIGIEKVIRVAELDSRTCKECEILDGEVYNIDEAPDVIIHDFCRCYYLPYDE